MRFFLNILSVLAIIGLFIFVYDKRIQHKVQILNGREDSAELFNQLVVSRQPFITNLPLSASNIEYYIQPFNGRAYVRFNACDDFKKWISDGKFKLTHERKTIQFEWIGEDCDWETIIFTGNIYKSADTYLAFKNEQDIIFYWYDYESDHLSVAEIF